MRPDLSNIKNIIFDLGNVLVNLDIDASVEAFQKMGLSPDVKNSKHAYSDPVFYAFEVGRITTEEFFNEVRRVINNPFATNCQIEEAWYAMIKDFPLRRLQVLQELRKRYRIYLFSNTNEIHVRLFHAEFKEKFNVDFPSLFEKDFYSHTIHERKPDVEAFNKVIELSGINPKETLFVDDLEKNTLGAEKAGMQAFWLQDGMEMADLFAS